ncbi:hypothetical protein [Mesorhizobium retamae]|uniref:Uncharacterized protein n=1 Tax=Mesorhizobium retamae TaxID=2912854 RepID=A0ABS9QAP8_9HYPH|nr:hypothetical protein [Mesorhizobium sp. IRAMC:0171]MCG7504489.1 hypothetical protein [Mesorhizobium sp. IRAMC:0171]
MTSEVIIFVKIDGNFTGKRKEFSASAIFAVRCQNRRQRFRQTIVPHWTLARHAKRPKPDRPTATDRPDQNLTLSLFPSII